eukprot:3122910-Rhodomonas_salina.1
MVAESKLAPSKRQMGDERSMSALDDGNDDSAVEPMCTMQSNLQRVVEEAEVLRQEVYWCRRDVEKQFEQQETKNEVTPPQFLLSSSGVRGLSTGFAILDSDVGPTGFRRSIMGCPATLLRAAALCHAL